MDKKKQIIEAASNLFSERGYYGVGLNELLTLCNIPKGSFYHYFPQGKKQLISEVLDYCYQSMMHFIKQRFEVESYEDTFVNMAKRLASSVENRSHFYSLTLSMCGIESVYLDKTVQQKAAEIYKDWQEQYYLFIHQTISDEHDARLKAQMIFSLVHGSMISSWIKQDKADLELIQEGIVEILKR